MIEVRKVPITSNQCRITADCIDYRLTSAYCAKVIYSSGRTKEERREEKTEYQYYHYLNNHSKDMTH